MNFQKEFTTLQYVFKKGSHFLLVAHNRPDGDTVGSVMALGHYLESLGKTAAITCQDEISPSFAKLSGGKILKSGTFSLAHYDAIIGCDSVDRGFRQLAELCEEKTVTVIFDHHPDINTSADVIILNHQKSSTCEIIYDFLIFCNANMNRNIATFLMLGILSDTGNFQHANTSTHVLEIASELMKKGASLPKIIQTSLTDKKISTLKLWGRAFEKARINQKTGMIATVLTKKDIESCQATTEDISQVASVLNNVPGTKFALVLSEREDGTIKGSLRSEHYKGIDVSEIAHRFGGGGHKLASGFEVKGKIVETEDGWTVV